MIYTGTSSQQYTLVKELAKGGEGTIYSIAEDSNKIAKIYHNRNQADNKQQEKILNMVMETQGESCQFIAWPLDALFDAAHQVCGFVMKKFNGVQSLAELLPEKTLNWGQRVLVAHNLCDVVREVHELNQCIGDMNPCNFGVDIINGHVFAFDADSFHYRTKSDHFFPCIVGLPEYYAPELQRQISRGQDMRTIDPENTFSRQTDLFALALLIFQLLFSGYHPFSGRRLPNYPSSTVVHRPSTNILNKISPYFNPQAGTTIPLEAPPITIVTKELQEMFRRAFLTEDNRPTATDWQRALFTLLRELKECPKKHLYHQSLSSCPWCALDAQHAASTAKTPPASSTASQAQKPNTTTTTTSNTTTTSKATNNVQHQSSTSAQNSNHHTPPVPVQKKKSTWWKVALFIFIIIVLIKAGSDSSNNTTSKSSNTSTSTKSSWNAPSSGPSSKGSSSKDSSSNSKENPSSSSNYSSKQLLNGLTLNSSYSMVGDKRTIGWTDDKNNSPYRVAYRYGGNTLTSQITHYTGSTYNKEWTFDHMIPGADYWIEITDSSGNSKTTILTGTNVNNFSDGTLTSKKIKLSISPRYKSSSSISDEKSQYKATFSASDIRKNIHKAKYGWKLNISYPTLSSDKYYSAIFAFYAPNGYVHTINYDNLQLFRSGGTFWHFFGADFFEELYDITDTIPSGKYKIELYLDGMLAASANTTVK